MRSLVVALVVLALAGCASGPIYGVARPIDRENVRPISTWAGTPVRFVGLSTAGAANQKAYEAAVQDLLRQLALSRPPG